MHNLEKIMNLYEKLKGCKSAELEIGELWEPEEFRDTLSALMPDSEVKVDEIPLRVKCKKCRYKGSAKFPPHSLTMRVLCPKCGSETEIISGNEIRIKKYEPRFR